MPGGDGPDDAADAADADGRDGGRRRGEAGEGDRGRGGGRRSRGGDGGLRFRLPPIRLPETAFPADLRVRLPAPGTVRRDRLPTRSVLVVALAFDALDAGLALAGVGPVLDWTRIAAGLGLAAALTGIYGSLYAWEAVAVALGAGWLTAVPSATLLLYARGRDGPGQA